MRLGQWDFSDLAWIQWTKTARCDCWCVDHTIHCDTAADAQASTVRTLHQVWNIRTGVQYIVTTWKCPSRIDVNQSHSLSIALVAHSFKITEANILLSWIMTIAYTVELGTDCVFFALARQVCRTDVNRHHDKGSIVDIYWTEKSKV